MGAVYDIEGSLKFRSSQDIVDITRKFVAQSDDRIRFGDDADFTDLEGALECIFTRRGLSTLNETETSAKFYSSFDASYGWEVVMMDWFESAASVLDDGSELKIWPDSGLDDGIVKGGKVTWEDTDDEDDFELTESKDMSSSSDPLERSIAIIEDYLAEEFNDTDPIDRNKLNDVGLLFTTYDLEESGGEVDLQVSVDLINNKMIFDVYGDYDMTEVEQFKSAEDLRKWLEAHCYWDDLYYEIVRRIPDDA